MSTTQPDVSYVAGLDLGQAQDFTALAILERSLAPDQEQANYAVRHLERFPLGTSYAAVVDRLKAVFAAPPLADSTLAVDYTGCGRPVFDLLSGCGIRAALCPVTITSGSKAHRDDDGGWLVPKKELVAVLQLLLQNRRLRVAQSLPAAALLVKEMENFRVKITAAAGETFEAWRDGDHDDLVLAAGIAAWMAERTSWGPFTVTADPESSFLARLPEGVFFH
jgi:hypothetical protein